MTDIERRYFLKQAGTAGALLLLPLSALAAPPEEKGKKVKEKGSPHGSASDDMFKLVRAGISVAAARDLFRDVGGEFGSYKPLPPGIRKNLARGKPIPPGIAKTRLSGDYVGRLPRHPGYEWVGAGVDLLLVQTASGLVADVLSDVFH